MFTNVYCTYFNIDYLSRSLALYKSMEEHIEDFKLYMFACDDESHRILKLMELKNAIIIAIDECIDGESRQVLSDRKGTSFFWSLAPLTILHVLNSFHEAWCTYVDADCYFYNNPGFVFETMERIDKSVAIVEHNFKNDGSTELLIRENGRFCVEFNTFRNNPFALKILNTWRNQCLESCQIKTGGLSFGDQLYLNEWPVKYDCVYIVEDRGIGVAPWNINNGYKMENIIMYHFHGLHFIGKHLVSLNIWNLDNDGVDKQIYSLYKSYIKQIKEIESTIMYKKVARDKKLSLVNKMTDLLEKVKGRKEKNLKQILKNFIWI